MASAAQTNVNAISNTPQAKDDTFGTVEGGGLISIAALMANDAGGNGKSFYGIYGPTTTSWGAALTVENGAIRYNGGDSARLQSLALGETVTDMFQYAIQLGKGVISIATVKVTVTGTNDGPVANADTAAITENQSVAIDALANDTDLDHGAVKSLVSVSSPKGAASIVDGKIVFVPGTAFDHLAQGATEVVTLTYTMSDEHGAESSATVAVTVTGTNDGPVAVADTAAGTENESLVIDVLTNDTDADAGHAFTLVSATPPDGKGSVTVEGGALVFTPGSDFDHLAQGAIETVIVSYTMRDDHGAESVSTATITVTGTNDAPVVAGAVTGAALEDGSTVALDALAAASDVDDGTTLSVVAPATLPAGVSFDAATQRFILDPSAAAYQTLAVGETLAITVNYAVTDGIASTPASVSWTVTGTNDAPVITSNAAATKGSVVEAGSTVAGTPTATGTVTSSDIDHDATATWSGNADGTYGSFAINAAGVWTYTLDDGRAVTEALAPGEIKTETFTATVTDQHGATAVQTVTIQITGSEDNRAPTAQDVTVTGHSGFIGGSGVAMAPYNGYNGVVFDHLVDTNNDGVADTPEAVSTLYGGYGQRLATGDIDGDGDVDIVTINGSQIWTYANQGDTNGDGQADFAAALLGNASSSAEDIALGDLNGDGAMDIAVTSYSYMSEFIAKGDTNGNGLADDFTQRTIYNGSSGYGFGVATGDMDGDGRTDIVNSNYESYWYGGAPLTITLNRGDTNGDGQIDYVTQQLYAGNGQAMGVAIGDINGDGIADLAVSYWNGTGAQVMIGRGDTNGDGQLEFDTVTVSFNDYVRETTLADLDGDGDLDLASTGNNGYVHLSLNQGDTNGDGRPDFVTSSYWVGYSNYGLAVSDLDGDGDLDVLAANPNGYYYGNSTTYLDNRDANGDGVPEFVTVQVNGLPSSWDAEPLTTGVGGRGAREDGPAVTGSFVGTDVDAGDTATLSYEVLTAPSEGSVVNNGDGTFSFNPGTGFQDLAQGETRDVTFTYRAVDSHGAASAPATVTVTVAGTNDAPIVTSSAAAATGTVVEAGNLDDGTVAAGTASASGTLASADIDHGATASWSVASGAGNGTYGTFAINAAGQWTYTLDNGRAATQGLNEGQTVTDSFTARVTDDHGAQATQVVTVTINGTNDLPTVSPQVVAYRTMNFDATMSTDNYSYYAEDGLRITTVDHFHTEDVDGDGYGEPWHHYTADIIRDGGGKFTLTELDVRPPSGYGIGTVEFVAYAYNANGQLVQVGSQSFASNAGHVTLSGVFQNVDKVVWNYQGNYAVLDNIKFALGGGVAFEDGPSLTGSFGGEDVDADDSAASLTYQILTQPGQGTVTNNNNGTFSYNPGTGFQELAAGETRVITFTYQATDSHGAVTAPARASITVTGTNDAPVITSTAASSTGTVIEAGSLDDGTVVAGTASATGALTSTDIDNGAPATWSMVSGSTGTYGSLSLTSAGAWTYTLNNADADTQALAEGQTGTDTFSVRVSDGQGGTANQTVTINVTGTNDTPVAVADAAGSTGVASPVTGEILVNTQTNSAQIQPTITALANGQFVVAWSDASGVGGDNSGYGIKAQLFSAAGAKVGSEFLVNTQTASTQYQPTVTALSGGGFVVAWADASAVGGDNSGYGIKAQLFSAAGAKVGSEFLVNTQTGNTQQEAMVTSLASGGFVATWTDWSSIGDTSAPGVRGQIYNASGAKVGSEFLVNTQTANSQYQPSVTGLSSGGFVVTWNDASNQGGDTSNGGVKAQIFDANGAKVGAEFLVNTQAFNSQIQPAITSLVGGGFVVTWSDASGIGADNSGYGVKAQLFTAAGIKVGSEFLVNTQTASTQIQPAITSLPGGGFMISWQDSSQTGTDLSSYGVKAQIFDAAGAKVGGEFLVNTATVNDQSDSALVSLGNGNVALVWADNSLQGGDSSGQSIKLRIFSAAPSGNENDTLTVDVLANDTDVDTGTSLTLLTGAAPSGKGTVAIVNNKLVFSPGTDFDHLAAGTTEKVAVTYTIRDEKGATATGTLTVTITGTNDAPIAVADTTSSAENQTLTIDVLANDTDVDAGDSKTLVSVSASKGAVSISNGQVVFDPGTAFDSLAAGESANATISYAMRDAAGVTSSSTATVTVTGTNDAPVIAGAATDASGAVAELAMSAADASSATLTDSGTIAFADLDASDIHSATVTPQSGGYLGTLVLGAVDQAANTVAWNFSVADSALEFLGAGETRTQTYNVAVSDGKGGTVSQTVSVVITGAADNAAPVASDVTLVANRLGNGGFDASPDFSGWTVSNALTNMSGSTSAVINRTGNVIAGDNAVAVLSLSGSTGAGGTGYGSTITSDTFSGVAGDVVRFTYQLSSGSDWAVGTGYIRDAATGQIVQTVFNYNTGFSGSTGVQTVDLTLGSSGTYTIEFRVGSYDSTFGTAIGARMDLGFAGILKTGIGEDTPFTFTNARGQFLGAATDANGDPLTIQSVAATSAKGATVTYDSATGNLVYNPGNVFQSLAQGQSTTDTISYVVSDGKGGTDTATATITVTGENDAPAISGAVLGTATEDGAVSKLSALANATDVDAGAVLSVVNVPAALPGGVTYDAATMSFTLDPASAAFQGLAAGQTQVVTVAYGVSDGTATTGASVSWTVTGTNDASAQLLAATSDTGFGADLLESGVGFDTLPGSEGADHFVFASTQDSGVGAGLRDVITNFDGSVDMIDLSGIDSGTTNGAFGWAGESQSVTPHSVSYFMEDGHTIIQGDINGDNIADFQIEITNNAHPLQASAFIL